MELSNTMRQFVISQNRTVHAQVQNMIATEQAAAEMDKFRESVSKGNSASKADAALTKEAISLKEQEIKLQREHQKLIDGANQIIAEYGAEHHRAKEALEAAASKEKRLASVRERLTEVSKKASTKVDSAFRRLTDGTTLTRASLVWFGNSLDKAVTQARAQYAANGGIIEGTEGLVSFMWDQQKTAIKLGVENAAVVAELVNKNRQLVNSLGGTIRTFDQSSDTVRKFAIMAGGNQEQAATDMVHAMSSLASKGIPVTEKALEQYAAVIQQTKQYTGKSTSASIEYYDSIMDQVDMHDKLRKARKDERLSILMNQAAMINNSIAAGKLETSVSAATATLNKMQTAKPLDRIKQAAKIRALGGALGLSGAEQAATELTKRNGDQQVIKSFFESAATYADQLSGAGLPQEIFVTSLLDKLDMEQYLGKGSDFSNTLNETLKNQTTHLDANNDKTVGAIQGLMSTWSSLSTMINGGTAAQIVAATLLGSIVVTARAILLKMSTGRGSSVDVDDNRRGGKAGKTTKAPSRSKPMLKNILKGGLAGAAVGAVGYGLGQAADSAVTNGNDKTAAMLDVASTAANWGALGATIGSVIPAAGTLLGGGLGALAGGAYGLYDNWDKLSPTVQPTASVKAPPIQMDMANKQQIISRESSESKQLQALEQCRDASIQTSKASTSQIAKVDQSNEYLKTLSQAASKQLEIAEKQLIALTLTEQNKNDKTKVQPLIRDTRFASQYNYMS